MLPSPLGHRDTSTASIRGSGMRRGWWGIGALTAALTVASVLGIARPGLAASDFNIVVVGGSAVVSDAILDDLGDLTTGSVTRVSGSNRFATATALTSASFDPGVPVVYVANGANFPDALAAAPVAALAGGPLLLVSTDGIPGPTATELTRLNPGKIVIVGGTAVVSSGVESSLNAYTAGPVERLAGSNRFATAAAISQSAFGSGVPAVFIAVGDNFPDALAASAKAAIDGGPILLTRGTSLPSATKDELNRLNPQKIYVVGGSAVISNAVLGELSSYTAGSVTRIAGANRFATAAAISADTFDTTTKTIYISTGLNFPDALAAGPLAGGGADNPAFGPGPILLVGSSVPSEVVAELARLGSNAAPSADADSVTVDEDDSVPITLTGSDPDGDPISFAIVNGPTDGSLSGTPPNVTYTPDADFNGSDSFTFKTNDGSADSPSAMISITVDPVNDQPTATNDAYTAIGNTPLRVGPTDPGVDGVYITGTVLINDSDIDGDSLSAVAQMETPTAHGEVSVNADGSFEYLPDAGFTGSDSFTYEVTDGTTPVQATVNITVDEIVWYLDNSVGAGGDGTLLSPHNITFYVEQDSSPGDTIFIYAGVGTTNVAGFDVQDNQTVIGEAAGLTVSGHEIVDPGTRPDLVNGINVNDNATLEGLGFSGNSIAIDRDGATIDGITVRDVEIDVSVGNTNYAVDLDNTSGDIVFESDVSIKNTLFVPDPVSGNGLRIGGSGNLTFAGSVERVALSDSTGTHVFTAAASIDGAVGRFIVQNSDADVSVLGSGTFPPLLIDDSDGTYTFGPNLTHRSVRVTGYGGMYNPTIDIQGSVDGANDTEGEIEFSAVGGSVTIAGDVTLGDGEQCISVNGANGTFVFNGGGTLHGCNTQAINVNGGTADIDFVGTWSIMDAAYGIRTNTAGGSLSMPATTAISGSTTTGIDISGAPGVSIMIDYDGSIDQSQGFAVSASNTDANIDMSGPITYTGTGAAINLSGADGTYMITGGGSVANSAQYGVNVSGDGALDLGGDWTISAVTAGIRVASGGPFDLTVGPDVTLAMGFGRSLWLGGTGQITVNAPITHNGSGWAILLGDSPTLTFNEPISVTGNAAVLTGSSGGTTTFNGTITANGSSNTVGVSGDSLGVFIFNGDVAIDGLGAAVSISNAASVTFNAGLDMTSTGSGLTISDVDQLVLDDTQTSIADAGGRALTLSGVGIPVSGLDFDGSITFSEVRTETAIYLQDVTGGPLTLANIDVIDRERAIEAYGVENLVLENITFSPSFSTNDVKPLIYVGQGGDLTITGGSFTAPDDSSFNFQAAGGSASITDATFTNTAVGEAATFVISASTDLSIDGATFNAGSGATVIVTVNATGGDNTITVQNSIFDRDSASWGFDVNASGDSTLDLTLSGNDVHGFFPVDVASLGTATVCMDANGNTDRVGGVGNGQVNVNEFAGSVSITQASTSAFNVANPGTGTTDDWTIGAANGTIGFNCSIS